MSKLEYPLGAEACHNLGAAQRADIVDFLVLAVAGNAGQVLARIQNRIVAALQAHAATTILLDSLPNLPLESQELGMLRHSLELPAAAFPAVVDCHGRVE